MSKSGFIRRPSSVEKAAAEMHLPEAPADIVAPAGGEPADIARAAGSSAADSSVAEKPAVEKPETSSPRRRSRRAQINVAQLRASGMVTAPRERSLAAEEFRLIKRPLLMRAFGKGDLAVENGHMIMVASSRPGEGKTFCALSLAMSIAFERDLTVLLVDADVSKPDIPAKLGMEADLGLLDLLAEDDLDLSDVLIRTDLENLTILPAGRAHHLATELLASEKMERLAADISTRYPGRVIIFDSPPVLMSSVPSVLALYVGQILLVIEAEKTTEAAVNATINMLGHCGNIGLLLNKARSWMGLEKVGAYYGHR